MAYSQQQQYFEPDEELSEIFTKLWEVDHNRCVPGTHYELDLQGYVTSAREIRGDWARHDLFAWLEEEVFQKETYKAFRKLLDNYETETGKPEEVTEEEEAENWHFLDVIMETEVMQEAHSYLVSKNRAPDDVQEFKELLHKLWFRLYKRLREDRDFNSSGFEHVFVGETRGHDVIGFHNWLQIYLQEKRNNIDYKGYFRRGTAKEEHPRLVTIQFTWNKHKEKPIGSSFIGTSPEFEIAIYTIMRLAGKGVKVPVRIGDYDVELHCFPHGPGIGTAYPISKE